jgi:hypothetical protein
LLSIGVEIKIGRRGFFESNRVEIFLQIRYAVSCRFSLTITIISTAVYSYPTRQPSFGSKTLAKELVTTTAFTLGLPRADWRTPIVPCRAGLRRSFATSATPRTNGEAI